MEERSLESFIRITGKNACVTFKKNFPKNFHQVKILSGQKKTEV
jgi:hypothetical protein